MDTPTCWAPAGCTLTVGRDMRTRCTVLTHDPAPGFWGHHCELLVDDWAVAQADEDYFGRAYQQWVIAIHQQPNVIEQ